MTVAELAEWLCQHVPILPGRALALPTAAAAMSPVQSRFSCRARYSNHPSEFLPSDSVSSRLIFGGESAEVAYSTPLLPVQ